MRSKASFLSSEQIHMLANIFAGSGHVVLGGLVFAPLLQPIDTNRVFMIIFGVGTVILCWMCSLWLVREGKETYEF